MKVLIVLSGTDIGGSERNALTLVEILSGLGVSVDVLCFHQGLLHKQFEKHAKSVMVPPPGSDLRPFLSVPVDAIHVFNTFQILPFIPHGQHVILTIGGDAARPEYYMNVPVPRTAPVRNAKPFIAYLINEYLNIDVFTDCHSNLDLFPAAEVVPNLQWTPTLFEGGVKIPNRALWVGRNSPEKGLDTAIAVAGLLPNWEFFFVIAGAVPDRSKMPQNTVVFENLCLKEQLEYLYSTSVVLLNTSTTEGVPMTFAEGKLFGCEIVSGVDVTGYTDRSIGIGANANDYAKALSEYTDKRIRVKTEVIQQARYKIHSETKFALFSYIDAYAWPGYKPTPTTTVVCYTYCTTENNRLPLLLRAVASVLDHSGSETELIIVDDGSEVNVSGALLVANPDHKHRLRLYTKPHTGIRYSTETFNYGIRHARGKYCIILGSDDEFSPDGLATLRTYLDTHPDAIAVLGDYMEKHPDGRLVPVLDRVGETDTVNNALEHTNCCHIPALLFRTDMLRAAGLPEDWAGDCCDYDMCLRLAEFGVIHKMPSIVGYRGVHEDNETNRVDYDTDPWKTMLFRIRAEHRKRKAGSA